MMVCRTAKGGSSVSEDLLCTTEDRVMTITLNRPDRGNRVTNEMAVKLTRFLTTVDPVCQVIVLRGSGDDFCLGRDVMGGEPRLEAYDLRTLNEVIFECYGAFRNSPIPIVGVVKGKALGFGCALAAICDITLATPESRFALPEMGHNIMPTMAMSSLVDRVARKAALYLTYSTEEVDAYSALAYGLISRIIPVEEIENAVTRLARTMVAAPLPANRAVKEYARHAFSMDISASIDFARNLHATINSSSKIKPA